MARERVSHEHYKRLSDAELQALVDKLPAQPPIWKRLRRVQRVCFVLGAAKKRFAFLNDTGTGKTLLATALARYFRATGEARQHLVLVERRVHKWEWAAEIAKHTKTSYCILHGSSVEKWQQFEHTKATLIIESYAGFLRMTCGPTVIKKGRRKGKVKFQPIPAKLAAVTRKCHGLIGDESHTIKNRAKLPFRLLNALSKKMKTLFLLTGTPFGKDPSDVWAQMMVVDRGYTLGETLGLFRAGLFKANQDFWGRVKYTLPRANEQLLRTMLQNASIRYEVDESELPPLVPIVKTVRMTIDAQTHYERAQAVLKRSLGNYQATKSAFLRMRQISSGFIGYANDETGERAELAFDECPKLESVIAAVASIDPRYKQIIFHEFLYSGHRLSFELDRLGIKFVLINGQTKDVRAARQQFNEDNKTQVLLLNNSMATGLNLQRARYGHFYESPLSPIVRKQARRRFERQFSEHKSVFQYDYVTIGTVDEQILEALKTGQNLFDRIISRKSAFA